MPWDGNELFVGDLAADGTLGNVRAVAGRAGEESIFQPAWSPAGDLHFASDRTGWWNLYRERDGDDPRRSIPPRRSSGGRSGSSG